MLQNSKDSAFYQKHRICLVGIGGASMSSLALMLKNQGFMVGGSDRTESKLTRMLEEDGISVHIGHREENILGFELVIRTAAIPDTAPEIVAAGARGIPVISRAQAWGELMRGFQDSLCVSGTHGKSTTTAMCTHIALAAGLDPTVMVGAELPAIGGNLRIGGHRLFIAEACEYCNSFLSFLPTVAVINNIEAEHLDFFRDLDDIMHSFRQFAELVPPTGAVAANFDDPNVRKTLAGYSGRLLTYGLSKDAQISAYDVTYPSGCAAFTLLSGGHAIGDIRLSVPGAHNLSNALGAAAASLALGIRPEATAEGLGSYRGIGRRFEVKGRLNGALVVDDYAHHPTEIRATLNAARALGFSRIICAFQPHTYARTAALFDDFVQVLSGADVLILADIYEARERNSFGVSSKDLADKIPGSMYIPQNADIAAKLREIALPGDLVLTMGAGTITEFGHMLCPSA
jgi:UDP-N-acetylmuramate--alanine ligase